MKIGVVGCGYVGLVTGTCLAEIGHHVTCIDNDPSKFDALKQGKVPIYEPGLDRLLKKNVARKRLKFAQFISEAMQDAAVIFIAVGTPPQPDGSADLTHIEAVAQEIAKNLKKYTVVVEKSTVPVQTGEEVERTISRYKNKDVPFDMVSNPEFLREGTAIEDFLKPDRIVLGVKSKRAEQVMRKVYSPIKAGRVLVTDLKSAELIKHASNSFLATKISFINSVSRICELVGADASQVAEGMGLDPRIGTAFLKPGIGFGGFCLPKDLEAFHYISKKVGYDFDLLDIVKEINVAQRLHFIKKLEKGLWVLKGKTIAVWGVAFKPHTDDVRFAPAIDIIQSLEASGAKIRLYDPIAMDKARPILKDVTFCKDAYEAVKGADALALITEWPQFKQANFRRVKKLLANPLLVDGRNCLDAKRMKTLGFDYYDMGRTK